MILTQTVEIPDTRWLNIKMPAEVPLGRAQIELKVIPLSKNEEKGAETLHNSKTPHTDRLLSLLSGIGEVNIDEIREERLAKHI